MKLTKSKNAQEARFYRDTIKGELCDRRSHEKDKTNEVIDELPFEDSLIRRILAKPRQDKKTHKIISNEFEPFVCDFIKSDKVDLPNIKTDSDNKFSAAKYFSHYGCTLTVEKDGETLEQLLRKHYENKVNIEQKLHEWYQKLQNRITYKKERLKTSITHNRIQLPLHSTSLVNQNNNRADWLFDFIIDSGKFNTYWEWYNYANLRKKLETIVNDNYPDKTNFDTKRFKKELLKFGGTIYDEVKQYNKELYQQKKVSMKQEAPQKEMQQYIFYLREVQAYFRHYFGSQGADKRLDTLEKVKVLIGEKKVNNDSTHYASTSYPEMWIKTHITNQLTALLIQNGKLDYYGKTENPTSDDLSNIKIEEAFKKQLFLSLAWAITRLNYFFDYGSNNERLLAEPQNNTKIADTNITVKGDILSEFDGKKTLSDEYQHIDPKIDTYIECFLKELRNDNNYKDDFQQKVCTTFPIPINTNMTDHDINQLLDVMDAVKDSVGYLRNNIFHPKKDCLYNLTTNNEEVSKIINHDYFKTMKNILKMDISRVNSCFKEQFRSTSITEVYSASILKNIFTTCQLEFHVYAPKYAGMPSFRKIYKRGANLCSSPSTRRGLSWFRDKPVVSSGDNLKKWQAYKNLLQIIYVHSFLPAVHNDESLVTDYIKETRDWSQQQSSKNNGRNPHRFRYNSMPKYNNFSNFADYMSELQRLQSTEESVKHDDVELANDDKNYYIDFVQDIFVRAFDQYLEQKLNSVKQSLLSIFNANYNMPIDDAADTLNSLFDKEEPIVRMQQNIPEKDPLCLLFYPFLRMLERRELSNLQQQVIRYRISLNNRKSKNLHIERIQSEKLEELIALLMFTFPDHIGEVAVYEKMVKKHFGKFIEGDVTNYPNLYCATDGKTLIQQKSMLSLMRSGALAFYADMFTKDDLPGKKYVVAQKDYASYKEFCELGEEQEFNHLSPIDEAQRKLSELHEKMCKVNFITQQQADEYREVLKDVNKYMNLRRKITFDSLYEIHLIHVDILSRFAAFAENWERDMHFLLIGLNALSEQRGKRFLTFDADAIDSIFTYDEHQPTMTSKFQNRFKNEKDREMLTQLCWCNYPQTISHKQLVKLTRPRNSIAHLNHMTQLRQNDSYQKSIIELLTSASKLLNYDLKRKNSVTRVLKELLQKYHIQISLCRQHDDDDHILGYTYKLKTTQSNNIIHLKKQKIKSKKGIPIPARDQLFVNCVEQLLEFSYNKNNDVK